MLAIACVVSPLAFVSFPPICDLPQHLLQLRLLQETLIDPTGPYRIQWLAPYGMAYVPLALGWAVAGPLLAGRVGVGVLLLAWVAALHALAATRRRPMASALLASVLAGGFSLYWGFLPFLAGFPWFLWWIQRTERSERTPERTVTPREVVVLAGLATALYLSHLHWFAAAGLWIVLSGLRARLAWRYQAARSLALLPGCILGALWLRVVRELRTGSELVWGTSPFERWTPDELVAKVVGGPRGLARQLVLAMLVVWLLLGLVAWLRHRRREAEPSEEQQAGIDRRLLWAGGLLLVLATFAPEAFKPLSIHVASRWWAPGVALVVLGLAAPGGTPIEIRSRALGAGAFAGLVLVFWTTVTVFSWRRSETIELRGFGESLAALPERSRLLGLNYLSRSWWFDGKPFLQMFAYGPAWKGGSANFSFSSFPASPVIDREYRNQPWTPALEWYPDQVRRSDFQHFDYVLVNAPLARLEEFPRRAPLEPVTQTAPWRLYRVVPPGAPAVP